MFDPKSSRFIGYSLWLSSSGELSDHLSIVIKTLAKDYNGPVFGPHVTLLTITSQLNEAEIILRTKKLVKNIKPFNIELGKIATEDSFFRSCYCIANRNNTNLQLCRTEALKVFEMQEHGAYMPHLSLYYGNLPQSTKDSMISSISLPKIMKFLVNRIYVYRTEGETQDWVRVGSFIL